MVELFAAPEKNTYLASEDIMLNVAALRSMKNPKTGGLTPQPDTYLGNHWYFGSFDYGGVHTNSGVINHWFYLLAEGSYATDEINDNNDTFSFSGIGTIKASNILFHAQHTYFTNPLMGYIDASNLIVQATEDLFGINSAEVFKVKYAWFAVGIGADPNTGYSNYISGPNQLTPGYRALYIMNAYPNATNYVWSIPTGCHYNYCWGITQGQGTNVLGIKAGSPGVQDITCTIYNGNTVIGSQYITVNVQNPYNGSSGNDDPCGGIETINGVIYPPDPFDSNGFASKKVFFKHILIYDFSGRKIIELKNIDNFNTNFLASGLYILKIELNTNEMITKKILK